MDSPSRIFISGIGTGVGKTLVAAIITEALQADYWKPIQAGIDGGTDTQWVRSVVRNRKSVVHDEAVCLEMPASPHIAASRQGMQLKVDEIAQRCPATTNNLVIEGAGGLLVPLNEREFVSDLAVALNTRIILVSRNYLGSINHSLLTASVCRSKGLDVIGWIFNDNYLSYEEEIAGWSGFKRIASIPFQKAPDAEFVSEQAEILKGELQQWL